MTPKIRRLITLCLGIVCAGIGIALITMVFRENIIFFYTPSDIMQAPPTINKAIRLGGKVQPHSHNPTNREFWVYDTSSRLKVHYQGMLPDLFRDDQGIVMEGHLDHEKTFHAQRLFIKHDEVYIPKDVKENLKARGLWRGQP